MSKFIREKTIAETAKLSKVSYRTVQRWVKEGRVKSRLSNGQRLVDTSTLPHRRAILSYDTVSQSMLLQLAELVQALIELQPVSDIKGINKRRELREAALSLCTRLSSTDRD